MSKGRRVGTLTSGVVLVVFGVLFLLKNAVPGLNYWMLLSYWPAILVMMGLELLLCHFLGKEEKLRIDVGSVFIMLLLTGMAFFLAAVQFCFEHGYLMV